ncbi:Gfo/Idh/MocA family oxidoreductase [Geitlerinema sp. PCC 9228]|jgi:biliverdin reductase|uniref:Gfo/Idh/MocA family protein n=1 Tax=Geitlerinema sp. PCC 9228 TaxID=111611 RepID=UPI0008F9CC9D|nr:Gfo/Idh/MocA family oxidoreductase [Geitlerinema sp. PCC 9228]
MTNDIQWSISPPVRVGLVGTGYAAKVRAEALQEDGRSQLVAVSGHTWENTVSFSQTYATTPVGSWQELVERSDIDLVVISNASQAHGPIAKAALTNDKHVVVEYPLALDVATAEEILQLARQKQKLLHIEHIELLGGWHQITQQYWDAIADVFYVRYSTINPGTPTPNKWSYNRQLFGFPLIGALSRINRLVYFLGPVATVACEEKYWPLSQASQDVYTACLVSATLKFDSGAIAHITYGKGDRFARAERQIQLDGEGGTLIVDRDRAFLVRGNEPQPLEIGSRRGLFAKDTQMVLDRLIQGTPLYIDAATSVYSLKVADAARRAAETGQTMSVDPAFSIQLLS